jgi:hypothetical protein
MSTWTAKWQDKLHYKLTYYPITMLSGGFKAFSEEPLEFLKWLAINAT